MNKITQLQKWLADNGMDVGYMTDPENIASFTGVEAEPNERIMALVVFPDQDPFLFTPQLEVEAAKKAGFKNDVYGYLDHEDPYAIIQSEIKKRNPNPKNWAVEKDQLTVQKYDDLVRIFPDAKFNGNASKFIEQLKLHKTPAEIALMEEAGRQADYAFEVGFKALKAGKTEQQIVAEIEYAMKLKGVMHMSFDTIVQAGANAANPHGGPEANVLKDHDMILFDLGTLNKGYMSDASRTVALGEPNDFAKEIHKVTLEAQLAAQDAAKPGITAAELDKVARDIIEKAGYGEYFIHRLGHGIGTSEHEYPSIMEGNDMIIEPGMTFSIEPGIYVPGKAGVRIEDSVYITDDGAVSFTNTDKNLLEF